MSELGMTPKPDGVIAKTSRRVAVALTMSVGVGLLLMYGWRSSPSALFLRTSILGLSATAAFAVFEAWPRSLPRWLERWALQVVAVGVFMPVTTLLIYVLATPPGAAHFWEVPARLDGWTHLTFAGLLLAPWTALATIVRQKEAFARDQKLSFALERSELEREALDARLHLLQAQVAPHFLFNTLANVQALVDAGSPHASAVLRSLTAYLRAAVPLLHEPAATIDRELQLVRPYLELMQMRMPDRLQYAMNVDPSALKVRCPPTTLLTLVENAVRHGIDPSEEGGRIDIDIDRRAERCVIRVTDTGAGLHQSPHGLGTGLTTLRERLQLIFGDTAQLRRRGSRHAGTNMNLHATALIADDEPLLRDALRRQLGIAWPELEIVAEARNGREAVRLFDERHPEICFLDVHMPGLSGVDAANHIGRRAHLVFVTAYDHYAVQAFSQGALDYLLKPVEEARLAETVSRLKERLQSSRPAINTEQLLQELSEQLAKLRSGGGKREALRWIRAQAGKTVRLIAIDDVDYLRSDAKYTIVAWRDGGKPAEAVVRTPLKELLDQLDAEQFAQVHRSVVVNLRAISHVKRHDNETAEIHVRGRDDVLPVSRNYLHLFRQM
jgi:DNA-binding LytR/AlgR family response regulator